MLCCLQLFEGGGEAHIVGGGEEADALFTLHHCQLRQTPVHQLHEKGEIDALPLFVLHPLQTATTLLPMILQVELHTVLVPKRTLHPGGFHLLHKRGLHLEKANGEVGTLLVAGDVQPLQGGLLHPVLQA